MINFDEEDEIVGVNIKLRDLYKEMCLPHYIWKRNTKPSENTLRELLEKYIIDNQNGEMLLILGQPGIGKSTLITWIVAELANRKKDIFVYQFATDLKDTNWRGEDILEEIIKSLRLKDEELKNKILILDGFDEIHTSSGREKILNRLSKEIDGKKSLGRFSLIITCRENYVNCSRLSVEHYITLQAWNEEQIKNFCDIYVENSLGETINIENNTISEKRLNKLLENKEIFGIPLILYMVLALNITIEEGDSIVDIYDQIFSLEGGAIYDRCYDMEHRINSPKIKKHIHRISQRIAFWIFENEEDEAVISQKNFEEICEYEMNDSEKKGEEIESDTLIGNFFKLKYSEGKGTDEIQFVHRSIYEYFVVVYFFESIHRLKSKEETAGKLGDLLKDGCLSKQILEFIKCKFDGVKGYDLSDVTRKVFNTMLRKGMTYYTKEGSYSNVMEREINIFSNMLEVVGLWNSSLGELDKRIIIYLQCNRGWQLNLSGIQLSITNVENEMVDLRGINLNEANLSRANLSGVNLSRAELVGANLSRANLIGTVLCRADLGGANLSEVDLSGSDLSRANLVGANLIGAELRGADLSGVNLSGVDLSGTGLSKAKLSKTDLSEADLNEINLSKTDLSEANLSRAKLKGAVLIGADLSGANLIGANLSSVKLRGADLVKADLIKTDLSGADLSGANLSRSDLCRANLSGADLSGANLNGSDLSRANLNGADLSEANLNGVNLKGATLRKSILSRIKLCGINLSGADLSGANLDGTDLSCAILNEEQVIMLYKKYDISRSMVLLSEEDEIISIQEYYKYYIRERMSEINY